MTTPSRAVAGRHGMVSTGHPLATLAGIEILRQGGSATDAAIAASAVSCVVLPHACGIGGDLFAVGYSAAGGRAWALNGSGKAPMLAKRDRFAGGIPEEGIAAATIPGIVDGWAELLRLYGTRSLKDLLQPAITHAEEGFIVTETLAELLVVNRDKLKKHAISANVFFRDGRAYRAGECLRQADLARTLRRIADNGPEDVYGGETAAELSSYSERVGGLLRSSDLRSHSSRWDEPLRSAYYGYEVLVAPPNSMGILLLVQLGLLQKRPLAHLEHNSAEYIAALLEAKRQAFKGVLPLLADRDSMPMVVEKILSSDFLDKLANIEPAIDLGRRDVSNTTSIAVVDGRGNSISLIQSIFFHFGCGETAGRTGILLNNRMVGFSATANHPNVVQGGKRPAHTLTPAMVLRNNRPSVVLSTPGAFAQTQTLCQVLTNLLVFRMELQQAIDAPRWFDDIHDVTLMESRIPVEVRAALSRLGHKVEVAGAWEPKTGSVQAVAMDLVSGELVLYGAADPRRNGCAIGW